MLAAALGFLPMVGPIIQGVSSVFTGYFSTKTAAIQAGAQVAISETQSTTQIIHDTADDIGLRFMRDLAIFPVVTWMSLIGWDTIISARQSNGELWHPWAYDWMFHVGSYPETVAYIPYAVIVFLFGNIGLNMWKRK